MVNDTVGTMMTCGYEDPNCEIGLIAGKMAKQIMLGCPLELSLNLVRGSGDHCPSHRSSEALTRQR